MSNTIHSKFSNYNFLEKSAILISMMVIVDVMIMGTVTGLSQTGELLIGLLFLIPLFSLLISVQPSSDRFQTLVSFFDSHMISSLLFVGMIYNLLYTHPIWGIRIAALALAVYMYEYSEHA